MLVQPKNIVGVQQIYKVNGYNQIPAVHENNNMAPCV